MQLQAYFLQRTRFLHMSRNNFVPLKLNLVLSRWEVPSWGAAAAKLQQTSVTGYLCGVENVDYLAEDGVAFALVFLADQLDVPKFAEVEVSLLL